MNIPPNQSYQEDYSLLQQFSISISSRNFPSLSTSFGLFGGPRLSKGEVCKICFGLDVGRREEYGDVLGGGGLSA